MSPAGVESYFFSHNVVVCPDARDVRQQQSRLLSPLVLVWCVWALTTTQNTIVITHIALYSNTLERPSNVLATTLNTLFIELYLVALTDHPLPYQCIQLYAQRLVLTQDTLLIHPPFNSASLTFPKHIFYLFKTHFPLNSGFEGLDWVNVSRSGPFISASPEGLLYLS